MAAIVDPTCPASSRRSTARSRMPILMGGAPRTVAIANGTLAAAIGLGLRLWIPGALIWAVGHAAAVWAAKRDPQFVDVVRRHLRYPHISASEAPDAQPRRVSSVTPPASPTACLGPLWSKKGSSSTRTAPFSARRDFAGPTSTAQHRPSWSASPPASTTRCAVWAPAGRSSSRPSGSPPSPIRTRFRSGLGLGRSRTSGRFRGSGRAFREPLLPDIRLAAAGRGRLTHRELALSGPRPEWRRSLGAGPQLRRSHQPCCNWSRASCPRWPGSMTAIR